ncbi:hypothetical protein F1649_13510 [Arcticibacter tournemirensis]|uniref:Uncharacterized protein n=1 Tax=Arcticibacter tournemirensis TaxID=699437 RepID=A0A5M9H4R2_9SPHI|nr:hypothetical protein [Arcticibacter tournemirensis]KAA8481926.1 hypothetical protein F1649_13510 [Arcticibacter tournemirensis]
MDDNKFNYKDQVLNIACMLSTVYRELFIYGLNAALHNELKDIKDIFEDGEEYPGDVALLEALDDENIKIILSAMYDIEEYGDSLLNINNISDKELNEGLENGLGSEYAPDYGEAVENDYRFWLNEVMGYTHLSVFNLLTLCYSLSNGVNEVPEEHVSSLYFPTDESLALLDIGDQNVKLLTELAFKLSDCANDLCEKL